MGAFKNIKSFFSQNDLSVTKGIALGVALPGLILIVPTVIMLPTMLPVLAPTLTWLGGALLATSTIEVGGALVNKHLDAKTTGTRNEASQTIVGQRGYIRKLESAQTEITNLCQSFNASVAKSAATPVDENKLNADIAKVVESVEDLRDKVQIFDSGASGFKGKYAFKKTVNGATGPQVTIF